MSPQKLKNSRTLSSVDDADRPVTLTRQQAEFVGLFAEAGGEIAAASGEVAILGEALIWCWIHRMLINIFGSFRD